MSVQSFFKTDKGSETEGIVIDYGDFWVKIARAGGANKRFQQVMEQESKPFRRAIEKDALPKETADKILRMVYAKAVMLDWGGRDGEAFPWEGSDEGLEATVDNYLMVFRELPEFFQDIVSQAGDFTMFRQQHLEDEAKN